jgi:adenosylcobyric acid synthase
MLSRIANFDDLDPLAQEPGVRLTMLQPGRAVPGDADVVVLPGTKSTRRDLAFLRAQGWDVDIAAHVRRGGHVLGICGGYQMLGRAVADPEGIEGASGADRGLGLLDVATVMTADKRLIEVAAVHAETGTAFRGYEIHIGTTEGPDRARPFAHVDGMPEGATSGRVAGSYLHGMFRDDGFRAAWLARFGATATTRYDAGVEATLDALADHLDAHLDVDGLFYAAR